MSDLVLRAIPLHVVLNRLFPLDWFQVFLDSPVIVNGVSVRWRGSVNLEKLDGVGGFRFDEDSSRVEDMAMQQQVDSYKHALRDWEDQQAR